jgi:isopentenyldiphosphate isomerase/intracellular septation protein A
VSKVELLKKMLPGFLPLFIFIAADEIWGTRVGLVVAIVFGILQLAYIFVKEKRFDKFVLFDTALITALGLVSILLNNDIFFKLKPALIGLILVAVLGISAFSSVNIMAKMTGRYIKGVEFSDLQMQQFMRSLKILFYIFAFHTLLVFYSAFFMSNEAWAFISGGLFYIIFGIYFIYELLRNKIIARKFSKEEWLPLVDEEGKVIGQAPRSKVHGNKDMLHPVVHLHILNSKNEIFLQKRPMFKQIQPGKWDTAVGGHVSVNESIEVALKRETEEEIGLTEITPQFIAKYVWESEVERELVFTFFDRREDVLNFNTNEIDDGKFWSVNQIKKNLKKGIFTPNFELEFDILRKSILKKV